MDKKTKQKMVIFAALFLVAGIVSIVQMATGKKVDGLQIGNILVIAIIGVTAVFVILHDKFGGGGKEK